MDNGFSGIFDRTPWERQARMARRAAARHRHARLSRLVFPGEQHAADTGQKLPDFGVGGAEPVLNTLLCDRRGTIAAVE